MKKFILIPDSFKGTMSSSEICSIVARQIAIHYPQATIAPIPVADGGEGSVDCFLQALGGERITTVVKNPFMEDTEAFYGILADKQTAIVEVAACIGLPLVTERLDPMAASTYGVGQLILHAVAHGCKKVVVGLGGSSTNDGGCGAACAIGIRFYNRMGETFVPTGGTLGDIRRIDVSGKDAVLDDVEIIAMCDVDNPMHGPTGAAQVFGPQKGADADTVVHLDAGLAYLGKLLRDELGQDVAHIPGSGAAGALGAGMLAFFGARLQMGIETVLDTVRFNRLLESTDLVITGEGKIDTQSMRGKVVIGVARRAAQANVPVLALVGDIGDNIDAAYAEGVSGIFSINRVAVAYQEARKRAKQDLALTVDNLLRFCRRLGIE